MSRRVFGMALLVFGCVFAASFNVSAAEKGKRARGKEAKRERAVMGDSILFAITHDDELKLTKEQKAFLQKLKQTLGDEREKEPEEVKIRELREEMRRAQKTGKDDETAALKLRMRELLEKQAAKWEERSNTELAKVLPKEIQAKLKELRGEPDKLPDNPFN